MRGADVSDDGAATTRIVFSALARRLQRSRVALAGGAAPLQVLFL